MFLGFESSRTKCKTRICFKYARVVIAASGTDKTRLTYSNTANVLPQFTRILHLIIILILLHLFTKWDLFCHTT